jgi:hypothetical protein
MASCVIPRAPIPLECTQNRRIEQLFYLSHGIPQPPFSLAGDGTVLPDPAVHVFSSTFKYPSRLSLWKRG